MDMDMWYSIQQLNGDSTDKFGELVKWYQITDNRICLELGVSKGLHTVVGHNYVRYWAGFIAMHVPAVTRIWFGRGCPAHKYRGANNNTTWTKNFPFPLCSIKNQVKKVVTPVKTHIKPSQHWGPGDIPVLRSWWYSRSELQLLGSIFGNITIQDPNVAGVPRIHGFQNIPT